jgi:glucose dehydrogenase
MWKLMQAIVLFATAGLVLSTSFLEGLGLPSNPYFICGLGLGITTMLMYRSLVSLLVMVMFTMLISLSDATLDNYNLDRDALLAFAIAILCLPWIQRLTN